MATRAGESTSELVQALRAALDRLALRVFYWLRLEGEARTLSPTLGKRIAECLNALLQALAAEDLAPVARFLSQEQERVTDLQPEARLLQTISLLDAAERTLEEALETGHDGLERPERTVAALHSLCHQARRRWLRLCTTRWPEATRKQGAAEVLASLGRTLIGARDLDQLVQALFSGLQQLIPHEDGQLLLWGARQETPLVRCANSRLFVGHGGTVDSYSNWVSFQRTPLLISDLGVRPNGDQGPAYRSYIGVPLLQGDHLVGTLALVSTMPNAFDQSDLEILTAIAPLLSVGIQQVVPDVGPLDTMGRRLEELNLLLTFGREVTAALEEGRIYSLLLLKAIELTDSDAGLVVTVDQEKGQCTIQALSGYAADVSADDALMASPAISWEVGIVGWVARTGRAALIPDVREVEDYLAVRPETRSQLTVPIRWRGDVVGVLNLESSSLNAYDEEDLHLVEMLADLAAAAIGATRLYNEIREKREWLAGLVANLPEGIIVTDPTLDVVLANRASVELLGLDLPIPEGVSLPGYLMSRLEAQLQEPDSLARFLERVRTLERGTTEGWLYYRDVTRRVWLVGAPLCGEDERPMGRVILVRDARQAEDSERAKLGFISLVSHELRSPLTSILGYAELLLSRDFDREEQRAFLEVIFRQADHLSRLVEDLLSLSRLGQGRMRLNCSMVSLIELVAGMASQLDAQMGEKHTLLVDIPADLPPIYLDRDKVRSILKNLIENAIKYSPAGGEIVLRAEAVTEGARAEELGVSTPVPFVLVSVQDQGIGIPEEALPHIFERFYRVDHAASRSIGGSGLGLTIAKALVELHGGTIWAKSRLGHGSTFYFTIPLRTHPSAAGPEPRTGDSPEI
ncbi:MAG: ATP-binding protein [Chloroflexia bacterium]